MALKAGSSPDWARDELILALDLYFRVAPYRLSNHSPEIRELSEVLQHLPVIPAAQRADNFRNPTGVNFKLRNFQYIDTDGEEGAEHYGANDKRVYEEFRDDKVRLNATADAIRQSLHDGNAQGVDDPAEDEEFPEGRILLRMHLARERNTAKVREKKKQAMQKHGRLACEVCDFDFATVYGERGAGFIECHHAVPLSQLRPGQKTKMRDLRLVCPNCHRMLHRGGEADAIEALRSLLSNPTATSR